MDETFPPSDLDHFQRNGFVIARGLASPEVVAQMRQVTLEGIERHIPPIEYEADLQYPGAPESRDAEGGRTARRLKMALGRSPVFIEFLSQPAVVGRLQQLLGPQVVCPLAHHNCIMTKQPAYSSDTGWHQDIRYWSFQRPELVNLWIALGEERPDNGGLWVIPGSHRLPFQSHQFDAAKFFDPAVPENAALIASRTPVTLAPGDALFFHCLTLHAATRNQTQEPKFSAVFTFRPGDNPPKAGTRSAGMPELVVAHEQSTGNSG
ncbi:MAG: phytanoyl-CoA dioxygenase family protein [Planctomycetaceae bacterium]|nr:phytanoyl-CoA dioxygenase family protein [Planctomycetaceae bacterium]